MLEKVGASISSTLIMIPLSFSIAVGFISYVAIKVIAGRISDITFGAWFLAAILLAKFVFFCKDRSNQSTRIDYRGRPYAESHSRSPVDSGLDSCGDFRPEWRLDE